MFDEVLRELRRLHGPPKITVSMPSDVEGYFDRECPSSECRAGFRVREDDWRDKVRDEEVFCPLCGHSADSQQWLTQEQADHVKKAALAHLQDRIGRAMRRDAENWNRRQPLNTFVRITMRADSRPRPVLLPAAAADAMRLKIVCAACACRYAVIGPAFFCPACGHNSAERMFGQSISTIRNALDALTMVRAAIADRKHRPPSYRERTSE